MRNKTPLISVIIPVYNIENYVTKCLKSVSEQHYRNLEVLVVDDGSTDGSAVLCDQFSAQDDRFHVLHKPNGGLSDSRNAALDRIHGEYVTFIDGDDWVSPWYIDHLLEAVLKNQSDLSVSWFENVTDGEEPHSRTTAELMDYQNLTPEACLEKMLYQDGIEINACHKMIRTELYKDLRYPVGRLYEDIPVTYELVKRAESIAVISNTDYYYLQRQGSIQNSGFSRRHLDGVKHMKQVLDRVIEEYPDLEPAAACRYFSTLSNIYMKIDDPSDEGLRHSLWNEMKAIRRQILKNSKARKKARLAALISYFGPDIFRFAYSFQDSFH